MPTLGHAVRASAQAVRALAQAVRALAQAVRALAQAVRALAQAVRCRPITMEARFRFQVSPSEIFLVDKVALRQMSLPVSFYCLSTLIHPSTTEAILSWHLSASLKNAYSRPC